MSAHVARPRIKNRKDKRRKLLWLTETQAALGWAVLIGLAAVLGAIYLHQASGIAKVGRVVQGLQYDLNEVKRVNTALELEIAEAQKLTRLIEIADRLGFVPATPDDIEYQVVPNYPVYHEPTGKAEPKPEPANIDTVGEALLRAFASRITDLGRGEAR